MTQSKVKIYVTFEQALYLYGNFGLPCGGRELGIYVNRGLEFSRLALYDHHNNGYCGL